MNNKIPLKMGALCAVLYLTAPNVHAHGWVEYPEARQSICYEQGGIWSGSPPNPACAQALAISGSYPFVQRNEYANLVEDYTNMEVVRTAVPDGTLCYANDSQKAGMGAAHSEWTRTLMSSGTFELVFNATAPHNPSYWEIYLTKQGVDTSQPLKWDDLELIEEVGNITAQSGKYRMNVTIPDDRSGRAVLFTRWQRIDAAGEGFYNCSDITIGSDTPPPIDPSEPYLNQGAQFVPNDISLDTPQLGEVVKYDVLNSNGTVHSSFSVTITEQNQADWDRLLAADINGYYESNYSGEVFIGRWHEEMEHYMYFQGDLYNNYFNSLDPLASGLLTIEPEQGDSDLRAVITPTTLQVITVAEVTHGTTVVLNPYQSEGEIVSIDWQQLSGPSLTPEYGIGGELILDTSLLADTQSELSFELTISSEQGSDSTVYSFSVLPSGGDSPEEPVDPVEPIDPNAWSASATYNEGDQVTHNGQLWTAYWWTQGDEPGTTGEWGVWRL
ncbi:lytic polysaccharide monooxygenase [Vibrio sp. WXL210]|uniref:lytic polysaccharide monooxygenase n=1 Tax=Vibrio sp. WXL210 TaxID=3450709 RepID=UPI003EC8681F